jgi:hypothetical protein
LCISINQLSRDLSVPPQQNKRDREWEKGHYG